MQKLVQRIKVDGCYLGDSILKVDSFLNHQVDSRLMAEIGESLYQKLEPFEHPITKVLTAETSGILPAIATANVGNCKMIYARKSLSKTMIDNYYKAKAVSRTRGNEVTLHVNKQFLGAEDYVLIIEDFLATGSSIAALIDIVKQSGAQLLGIGTILEKPEEQGRKTIRKSIEKSCTVVSLSCVSFGKGINITLGKERIEQPEEI